MAIFLQVVLDGMSGASDVELPVNPIHYQRSVPDQGVTRAAGFEVTGTVIEVNPAEVVLIDPRDDQALQVAILVQGQRRIEVERCDLVLVEKCRDNLICVLTTEHRADL